jgi:hypothetical protein
MNHALAKLVGAIDWSLLEKSFGAVSNDGLGSCRCQPGSWPRSSNACTISQTRGPASHTCPFGLAFFRPQPCNDPLISAKQADFMRYGFASKRGQCIGAHIADHGDHHIALAPCRANHGNFTRANAASSTAATAFIPVAVFRKVANECFISMNNTAWLQNIFISAVRTLRHIDHAFLCKPKPINRSRSGLLVFSKIVPVMCG